jgi:peptidyl-prolyl cis-trans isomerase SurA
MSDRGRAPAVASTAAPATPTTEAGTSSEANTPEAPAAETSSAAAPAHSSSARVKNVRGHNDASRKHKREKIRFGRAPATRVSDEQVANSAGSSDQPGTPDSAKAAAMAPDVQPLGPDLQHTPTITQPKQQKTRFSDEARKKSERKAVNGHKQPKAKTVKKDNAKPTSLTPAETANRSVQSQPLGLAGDTTRKKKKKAKVTNGEKTRLSDQKAEKKKGNGGTSSGETSSPEAAPVQQPQ